MSPVKYVQEAVRYCTDHSAANYGGRFRLPKKVKNPFKMGYDFDTSPELDPDTTSYYQTVIELGRINIITKVSLLSSHIALPREG